MSRSSKKHPWVTDHKLHNDMKKFANKKVRHEEDLPNGRAFKKVFCSYDICDYKWRQTKEEAIEEYENALKHPVSYLRILALALEEILFKKIIVSLIQGVHIIKRRKK